MERSDIYIALRLKMHSLVPMGIINSWKILLLVFTSNERMCIVHIVFGIYRNRRNSRVYFAFVYYWKFRWSHKISGRERLCRRSLPCSRSHLLLLFNIHIFLALSLSCHFFFNQKHNHCAYFVCYVFGCWTFLFVELCWCCIVFKFDLLVFFPLFVSNDVYTLHYRKHLDDNDNTLQIIYPTQNENNIIAADD